MSTLERYVSSFNCSCLYSTAKIDFISLLLFLSSLEGNENDGEIDDLLAYLQQQLTVEHSSQKICQPEVETSHVHISGNKFTSKFFFLNMSLIMVFLPPNTFLCAHSIATRGADVHLPLGRELGFGYASIRAAFPRLQGFLHLCKVKIIFALMC